MVQAGWFSNITYKSGGSLMKVLVTYFSQSGNTEKIAKAICEEAAKAHTVELKKLEDVTPDEAAGYDFLFIGSPLHSASLAAPVKECLGALKPAAGQKMALFITHFAPAYPDQEMDGFAVPAKAACEKNGMAYKGCFDCKGYLADALHEPVKEKLSLDDDAWAGMVEQMTGRPNGEDEANAQAFAKKVLD